MVKHVKDDKRKDLTDENGFKTNHFVNYIYYPVNLANKSNVTEDQISTFDSIGYSIHNNNPILNTGDWYAVNYNGKTIYSKGGYNQGGTNSYFSLYTADHTTTDPNYAYSGPVNIINSNLHIENGAVVSGLNYFSTDGNQYTLTVDQNGKLQNSNIFNQNVYINNGFSSNNNYYSCPTTMAGNTQSDNDSFTNAYILSVGSWTLTGIASQQTPSSGNFFFSKGGTTTINIKDSTIVTNPTVTADTQVPADTRSTQINVDQGARFGKQDFYSRNNIDEYLNNIIIKNDYKSIIGDGSFSDYNVVYVTNETFTDANGVTQTATTYRDSNNNVLYRGNGPVNIYNVSRIIVRKGAVLDHAQIFGGTIPSILVENGGILQNSNIFDSYIGIQNGGQSLNNTYYSPEFWYSRNNVTSRMEGISKNDKFYESAHSYQNLLDISDNANVYFDQNGFTVNDPTKNPSKSQRFSVVNGFMQLHIGYGGQFIDPSISSYNSYYLDYFGGGENNDPNSSPNYNYPGVDPDLSADTSKNPLKFDNNVDFANYTVRNNNPILDGTIPWHAVKLDNGKTVYQRGTGTNGPYFSLHDKDHLTNDPNKAYSGPVNIINSDFYIENGAVVSGLNFLASDNSRTLYNNGGTLQDSNIFNQNVIFTGNSHSNNNTFISCPVNISGTTVSDGDSFVNFSSKTGYYDLKGISYTNRSYLDTKHDNTFLSSDNGSADVNVNDRSIVRNPHIPNVPLNNSNNTMTINVVNTAQFETKGVPTGPELDKYLASTVIQNDSLNIIGPNNGSSNNCVYVYTENVLDQNGKPVLDSSGVPQTVNVYRDSAGHEIYRGNKKINFYNVYKVIVTKGAVLDGAQILGNNIPRLLVQNGGTIKNSKFYDGYVGIEQGGQSINNTYYSPEFWYSEWDNLGDHRMEGTSQDDKFFESSGTVKGLVNIANNECRYIDGNNNVVYNDKSYNPPNNTQFTVASGTTQIHVAGNGKLINPTISSNSKYILDYRDNAQEEPCYLCGTMIETRDGLKAIEEIRAGDMVYAYEGSARVLKPVTWVGSGHHSVRRNRPDDVAGYAIHIVKDALADNIPYKDMRITPEHCLYIDEKFIPARMLVNHHSIRYDYSKTEYTYYHLELEKHGVIKADGVLSESYLNTDNHKNFHNPEKVVQLRQETKDWAQDAAAPLETSREAVEPVHAHLKQRALHLGMKNMVAPETITHSTNLHIITDKGEVIHPQWPVTGNGNYVFVLPSPVHHVHIVSNSSRPCDAIGPFVDDRRNLGVLIETITLFDNRENHYVKAHLETRKLEGWHNQENIPCRWTDGYALLPLDQHVLQKGRKILTVKVIAAGPYISQNQLDHKKIMSS